MKITTNKQIDMFNYVELENKERFIALNNMAIMKVENYKQAKELIDKREWTLTLNLIGALVSYLNEYKFEKGK